MKTAVGRYRRQLAGGERGARVWGQTKDIQLNCGQYRVEIGYMPACSHLQLLALVVPIHLSEVSERCP